MHLTKTEEPIIQKTRKQLHFQDIDEEERKQ